MVYHEIMRTEIIYHFVFVGVHNSHAMRMREVDIRETHAFPPLIRAHIHAAADSTIVNAEADDI